MKLNRAFWLMIGGSSACTILAIFGSRQLLINDGVSVGWLLFTFGMVACGGFGFALTLFALPIKERVVALPVRIILFGITAGLLWSLAPGGILDQFRMDGIPTVLIASGLTGIVVSYFLYKPLMTFGRLGTFLLGIGALPLGAFCFGVCESIITLIKRGHTGTGISPTQNSDPFVIGAQYAALSMVTPFAVIFIPLAILTTFFLRAIICSKQLRQPDGTMR